MFEHVGAAHYDEFFAKCRELLTDDGVMLLHTIGKLGGAGTPDPFTDKWIFPGYHLPALSQMCGSSEKVKMIVSDVETLRLHYSYTLRHWLERATRARAKIEAMYDERFFRMWEFYLAGGIVMFETGAACNYQVQYVRDRRATPITRDYMVESSNRKYRGDRQSEAGAGGKEAAQRRKEEDPRTGSGLVPRTSAVTSGREVAAAGKGNRGLARDGVPRASRACAWRRSSGVIFPSWLRSARSKCASAAACASASDTRPSWLVSAISNRRPAKPAIPIPRRSCQCIARIRHPLMPGSPIGAIAETSAGPPPSRMTITRRS